MKKTTDTELETCACLGCENKFEPRPNQIYCSQSCKSRAYRFRKQSVTEMQSCANSNCNQKFIPRQAKKYCSRACKNEVYSQKSRIRHGSCRIRHGLMPNSTRLEKLWGLPSDAYTQIMEDYLVENDWSKKTVGWARSRLKGFLAFLNHHNISLNELRPGQFVKFMSQLRQQDYSYSTRYGTYTTVASFYRWLKRNDVIQENFFANTETRPKRPRKIKTVVKPVALTYIRALLLVADREHTTEGRRNAAIIRTLALTGMRREEVVNLTIPDIDFEQESLLIRGKFDNERWAFIVPELKKSLKLWLSVRPHSNYDNVFLALASSKRDTEPHPLRPDAINAIVNKLKREAQIPKHVKITPHQFRHTFATEMSKSGNPFALQILLGHSDIKTTEIYVEVDEQELKRLTKKYVPRFDTSQKKDIMAERGSVGIGRQA